MRSSSHDTLEVGKTIQLPDSIKRKLPQEPGQNKKIHLPQAPTQQKASPKLNTTAAQQQPQHHTTTAQLMQAKHDREEQKQQQLLQQQANTTGINVITIAGHNANISNGAALAGGATSSTAATVSSSSTNGFSPRIEDIDFRNDIIFDAGSGLNGATLLTQQKPANCGNDIINLGNFDNSLPPTFFKNLCNSSRHEALGLYVANVMNRLSARSAAKLELGILKSIIDVQCHDLESQ